jgi:hypothetical protein
LQITLLGYWPFVILGTCMTACSKCKQISTHLRLLKCVLCFKLVCERCAIGRYAQKFCSLDCANSFFLDETGELTES